MPETRDPQSVVDAAEQAAAAGDYASAEQLLREAALLQEASLGPLHPDLANTLNNLGVVCEITEKPGDAEDCFRRACAIASSVLEPDHPFVATSRKNLEDFCAARGKAVDLPAAPSVSAPISAPAVSRSVEPSEAAIADDRSAPAIRFDEVPPERPSYEESRPVASRRWSRPPAIGAMIAGGLLLGFIATATWLRSNDESQSERPSVSATSPATTGGSPPSGPIAPEAAKKTGTERDSPLVAAPKTGVTAPPPPTSRPRESSSPPIAGPEKRITAASPKPALVATAQLCEDFSPRGRRGSSSDWRCVRPTLPVGPGPLVFYTRVKSPTVTTIEHRWYRDDRLRQAVELPIRANTTAGYRTYSRQTVDNRGAGNWRVELRTKDGVLLHEERFVVR
jgi:DUF2914 family protein/tetratricopeptide repeat protein